jgi:hypothetical protein
MARQFCDYSCGKAFTRYTFCKAPFGFGGLPKWWRPTDKKSLNAPLAPGEP